MASPKVTSPFVGGRQCRVFVVVLTTFLSRLSKVLLIYSLFHLFLININIYTCSASSFVYGSRSNHRADYCTSGPTCTSNAPTFLGQLPLRTIQSFSFVRSRFYARCACQFIFSPPICSFPLIIDLFYLCRPSRHSRARSVIINIGVCIPCSSCF